MEYWPSVSWEAFVESEDGSELTISLTSPWAIIGSSEACHIRIADAQVPEFAFIAFSFHDWIEVWPIGSIPYPRWDEEQNLLMGRSKISLRQRRGTHEAMGIQESIEIGDMRRSAKINTPRTLQVDSAGKGCDLLLDRRVMILGERHPSTLRVTGVGLERCQQAVLSTDNRCWLIDLRLDTSSRSSDPVTELHVGDRPFPIGEISVSLRLSQSDATEESNSKKDAPPSVQAHDDSASKETIEPTFGSLQGIRAQDVSIDETLVTGFVLHSDRERQQLLATSLGARDLVLAEPEIVTSQVTERLVQKSKSKWRRRQVIQAWIAVTLFVVAGLALAWIAVTLLHTLPNSLSH